MPSCKNVSILELTDQSHRETVSRVNQWLGILPNRRKVDKIVCVYNGARYRTFLERIEATEERQIQSAFKPDLTVERDIAERECVLRRLDALRRQVSHNRAAHIVRMWHGCHRNALPDILSEGFAPLGGLDDGWYGKGIYFTSSAAYAARYCNDTDACLIMCYILILNPFPIVFSDGRRFNGRGNYKNYQCHYIPVSPVGGSNTLDYQPPPSGTDDALYDELTVFQEATILPQIVVYLK